MSDHARVVAYIAALIAFLVGWGASLEWVVEYLRPINITLMLTVLIAVPLVIGPLLYFLLLVRVVQKPWGGILLLLSWLPGAYLAFLGAAVSCLFDVCS